jgi:hypothetical protein
MSLVYFPFCWSRPNSPDLNSCFVGLKRTIDLLEGCQRIEDGEDAQEICLEIAKTRDHSLQVDERIVSEYLWVNRAVVLRYLSQGHGKQAEKLVAGLSRLSVPYLTWFESVPAENKEIISRLTVLFRLIRELDPNHDPAEKHVGKLERRKGISNGDLTFLQLLTLSGQLQGVLDEEISLAVQLRNVSVFDLLVASGGRDFSKHLSEAAELGAVPLVERLLQLGASVHTPCDQSLCSPLHAAAYAGHLQVLDIILNMGADPAARNAYYVASGYEGVTALHVALLHQHETAVERLLSPSLRAGVSLDTTFW